MTSAAVRLAAPAAYAPDVAQSAPSRRIASIDIVRGIVMVLMAIDHVRVYAAVPAGGPDPAVFFTRWITHFVAPAFVFLAGTSAYLHGLKLGDTKKLARFLVTRGAWLILLELTVVRLAWTFNVDFANYNLAGVIWVLGWCMIVTAAFVRAPVRVTAIVGCAVIAGHHLLALVPNPDGGALGAVWRFLYGGWVIDAGGLPPLFVLYTFIPWIGVMLAGYAFGSLMTRPAEERKRIAIRLGVAAIAMFVVIRAVDVYGDPNQWRLGSQAADAAQGAAPPAVLRFLNTSKYPASLAFLLMTLGPMLLALGVSESSRGRVARVFETFGRVPMFYYLLHIPLIHVAAILVSLARTGGVDPWLFGNHPLNPPEAPAGYRWSLPLLYGVFAACVIALYFPSRWFARLRASGKYPILSYL